MKRYVVLGFFILVIGTLNQFVLPSDVYATVIDDLKKQIEQKQQEIKNLEAQAVKYSQSLTTTQQQKNTLASELTKIGNQISVLNLQIKKTQLQADATTLQIEEIRDSISTKEGEIQKKKNNLTYTIRVIDQSDKENNALLLILSTRNFSDVFNQQNYILNFQNQIKNDLATVKVLKNDLEVFEKEQEQKRRELKSLGDKLKNQSVIVNDQKDEKNSLLKQTKNKEKEYQNLLAIIARQRGDSEKEISGLETKLRAAIDRSKLPIGKGILEWPLESVRLTQNYGKPNWQAAYDFHNGIDLAASVGTPVKAALSGTIVGIGNNGRYAYGKWISIDHGNNITTLYGHLSLQVVKIGQIVKTGDVIGYSGSTGYSTGPHLHFSVFSSESYTLLESTKVPNLFIPVGGTVNPLDYL